MRDGNIETIQNHRFIVHNRAIKHANVHEIVVDLFNAEKDQETGVLKGRGNLSKVADSLDYFKSRGIDTLYMSGVHKRAHDDPYSVASRTKIDDGIGGEAEFKDNLLKKMKEKDMKIIVDFFDRIGSIHMSKKYRKLLVNYIDPQKNFVHYHGANGKSNFSFSSTSLLNYRKKEAWDLLIEEAITFVREYGINGLHLDNCDLWPTMKRIDKKELFRKDADGDHSYTSDDILSGIVIDPHEDRILWHDCTD